MLLGFKKRFVMPIKIGTKVFTMRDKPKRTPKIGETLHMYTGLRTNKCELITNKEKLISIQRCYIYLAVGVKPIITVDGRALSDEEIEAFVKYDGFENYNDFQKWWLKDNVAVAGNLDMFHWTDLRF